MIAIFPSASAIYVDQHSTLGSTVSATSCEEIIGSGSCEERAEERHELLRHKGGYDRKSAVRQLAPQIPSEVLIAATLGRQITRH